MEFVKGKNHCQNGGNSRENKWQREGEDHCSLASDKRGK
jgi:hypothetical protein